MLIMSPINQYPPYQKSGVVSELPCLLLGRSRQEMCSTELVVAEEQLGWFQHGSGAGGTGPLEPEQNAKQRFD